MPINKGLKSLAESQPNFSNQTLENAIDQLKIGWVAKSIDLDTTIQNNSVLTASQKNDVKDTINNIAYLNAGRYLGDIVRHSNTILNGSILPVVAGTENFPQGTFLEIMQLVFSLQNTIPQLYGESAEARGRGVDDHFGILNKKFLQTEDSSKPVFDSMRESISFINNAGLSQDTAYQTSLDNLKNFIQSTRDDSTDFQQTLDTFASAVASAATSFDTALQSVPYSTKRTQMINDRDSIVTQINLENTNIVGLRDYTQTLSNTLAYVGLAENDKLKKLLINTAQNNNWVNYFTDYEQNLSNMNPIYEIKTDSDKSSVIDSVLASRGLPDVLDSLDLDAVAKKAEKDDRIDTRGFDALSSEQIITKCCQQLGIDTAVSIYSQSATLLSNLNQRDRDVIANALDLNESSNTLN